MCYCTICKCKSFFFNIIFFFKNIYKSLFAALFLGEANITRLLLTHHSYGVTLDRHLLNVGVHQNYSRICSNQFPYRTESLYQPWYLMEGEMDQAVCTMCALVCHANRRSVSFQSIGSGRCACSTLTKFVFAFPIACFYNLCFLIGVIEIFCFCSLLLTDFDTETISSANVRPKMKHSTPTPIMPLYRPSWLS
jgi:hypothetical protein